MRMTGLQKLRLEYVIDFSRVSVCGSLQHSCLPGKSANYNIKAVSTSDLFAFALYAITLNQKRSVVDVGPMQKLLFFYPVLLAVCTIGFHHSNPQTHSDYLHSAVCIHGYDLNNNMNWVFEVCPSCAIVQSCLYTTHHLVSKNIW